MGFIDSDGKPMEGLVSKRIRNNEEWNLLEIERMESSVIILREALEKLKGAVENHAGNGHGPWSSFSRLVLDVTTDALLLSEKGNEVESSVEM